MKTYNETESKMALSELFPEADIKVTRCDKDAIYAEISQMYEAPGLGFKKLMEVSQRFCTMNINADNDINSSGCETCDYGSAYGFTLLIRPEEAGEV